MISQQAKHVPPWVMAPQHGGEFNAFPDLPPPDDPVDLADAGRRGLEAAQAAAALRPLGVTGMLGPVLDVGSEEGDRRPSAASSTPTIPRRSPAYADETVTAYRKARMFAAVGHFPGLGAADRTRRRDPRRVGLSLPELRSPRPAAVRGGVREGRAGGGAEPRALCDGRLHAAGVPVAQGRDRAAAAASSASAAWR